MDSSALQIGLPYGDRGFSLDRQLGGLRCDGRFQPVGQLGLLRRDDRVHVRGECGFLFSKRARRARLEFRTPRRECRFCLRREFGFSRCQRLAASLEGPRHVRRVRAPKSPRVVWAQPAAEHSQPRETRCRRPVRSPTLPPATEKPPRRPGGRTIRRLNVGVHLCCLGWLRYGDSLRLLAAAHFNPHIVAATRRGDDEAPASFSRDLDLLFDAPRLSRARR